MITAVFRLTDIERNLQSLAQLGLFESKQWYADAVEAGYADNLLPYIFTQGIKYESIVGGMNTPYMTLASGEHVITVKLNVEDASKIPLVVDEDFFCDWRSDESYELVDGAEVINQWPSYAVPNYNEEGNLDGTRLQNAGRIA